MENNKLQQTSDGPKFQISLIIVCVSLLSDLPIASFLPNYNQSLLDELVHKKENRCCQKKL